MKKATYLGYVFRTGVDTSTTSPGVSNSSRQPYVRVCSGQIWFGEDWL